MNQKPVVLGAVQTHNKKTVPTPKSLLSKYKRELLDTDRDS